MSELNLDQFDPKIAQLNEIVLETKKVTKESGLDVVKSTRLSLRDTRVSITKKGKELREEANAFSSAVIAKEKELIAILAPEEKRLQEIEDEVKAEEFKKLQLEKLPSRKEKLAALAIEGRVMTAVTDEYLLSLDGDQFEAYYNSVVAERNEIIRQMNEEEQAKKEAALKAEEDRIKAEQQKRDDEIAAKQAEEQKKIDEANAKIALEQAAIEKEKQKIQHEKEVAEAAEEARKKALQEVEDKRIADEAAKKAEDERIAKQKIEDEKKAAKNAEYQSFLKGLGVTKENFETEFKIVKTPTEVQVYKLVGSFKGV